MKKLLLALAFLLLPVISQAQTAQVVVLNALARVVGPQTLSYNFCTYADGNTDLSAVSYNTTISSGGRGSRPVYLRATLTDTSVTDASGSVLFDQAGPVLPVALPLPVGCYVLTIQAVGVGTANQGAILVHVDVPYTPAPPPPPVDDNSDD